MTLALEYRPQVFADVVGQNHVKTVLRAMVVSQNVPPSLLFAGTRGTGKTTTGRILAAALNCADPRRGDACGVCPSCRAVQKGSSLSVLEIDAASNGLVADVRKLKEMVGYAHEGVWRVVLLDEVHSMSKEAFNALLKVLEEPPANTVFVLLTTEPDKVLETVVSRSMRFEFRRLSVEQIAERLRAVADSREIVVSDELLDEVARRAEGGMRDALMMLDQLSRVEVSDVEGFRELYGIHDVSARLVDAAIERAYDQGAKVLEESFRRTGDVGALVNDLAQLVTDLLVIRSGGESRATTATEVEERRRLAARVTTAKLVAATRLLWELRMRVRQNDNDQRATMELAFALLSDALAAKEAEGSTPIPGKKANAADDTPMSLSEMKQMASAR